MKRILLDTNVYGKLVEDTFIFPLLLDRKKCNDLVVYGTDVIRKELRAISKKAMDKKGQKIRMYTLYVYDKRTMLSTAALVAYKRVNQEQGFQNPNYMQYVTFRDKLLKKGGI